MLRFLDRVMQDLRSKYQGVNDTKTSSLGDRWFGQCAFLRVLLKCENLLISPFGLLYLLLRGAIGSWLFNVGFFLSYAIAAIALVVNGFVAEWGGIVEEVVSSFLSETCGCGTEN